MIKNISAQKYFKSSSHWTKIIRFLLLIILPLLVKPKTTTSYFQQISTLNSSNPIITACINNNKSIIIAGTQNRIVQIWKINEIGQYSKFNQMLQQQGPVYSVAVTQGNYIVIGTNINNATGNYSNIQIWNFIDDKYSLQTLVSEESDLESSTLVNVGISNDHSTIVASINTNALVMYKDQLSRYHIIKQLLKGHTLGITSLDISQDKQTIVTCGYDYTIRIWKLNNESFYTEYQTITVSKLIKIISINADSNMIVGGSSDYSVLIWILEDQSYVNYQTLYGHESQIISVDINSDDSVIVTGTENEIKIWKPNTIGRYQDIQMIKSNKISSVMITDDSEKLIFTSFDGKIKIFQEKFNQICQNSYVNISKKCINPLLLVFVTLGILGILIIILNKCLKIKKQQNIVQSSQDKINDSLIQKDSFEN